MVTKERKQNTQLLKNRKEDRSFKERFNLNGVANQMSIDYKLMRQIRAEG